MNHKSIVAFLTSSTIAFGAVNDIIPSDYEAPLVGTTVMSVNYLQKELHAKALPNEYIKQQTYALRYNYGFDLDGKTLSFGVALPYTTLTTKGSVLESILGKESQGLSDSVLSATYWFVNDRKNKDFLATTVTLTIPNGSYETAKTLNPGENRYKSTFNIGYISKLSESIIVELSPEIAFYGDAKTQSGTLSQKPSYAINSNFRYKPNNKYELFLGAQENYQSETTLNTTDKNDNCFYQKYSLGGAYYTDKFHQLMIRFAKETDKEYGFIGNNEVLVRYRWWFK